MCNNLSFLVLICFMQMVLFAAIHFAWKLCKKVQVVGRHNDGLTLRTDFLKQTDNIPSRFYVKISSRLIGKDDFRLV